MIPATADLEEAVHSVAMEHKPDCTCTTCKAAQGDSDALATIYRAMQENKK